MTTYVGPLGGLMRVPCLSDLAETVHRRRVWHEGIDGSPAVSLGSPGRAWRTWSCGISAVRPEHLAAWRQVALEQDSPYWFVPCRSYTSNLLTYRGSLWYGWDALAQVPSPPPSWSRVGPVNTVDGRALSSATFDYTGASWLYQSPIVPVSPDGASAVAALYVRAASGQTGQIRIVWVDGSGQDLGSGYVTAGTTSTSGTLVRVVAQAAPNPGAAGYRIQLRRVAQAAWPSFTWGGAYPWTEGKASDRVVVGDVGESVITGAARNSWSSSQFEVREVR